MNGETYEQIDFIKRNILNLYQEDLAKYDDENHEKSSVVFKTIPEQLENKTHISNCQKWIKTQDIRTIWMRYLLYLNP